MPMTSSYFSTEAYPADRRADAWKAALGPFSLAVKHLGDDGQLRASAQSIVSPLGISFARIASGPQELSSAAVRGEAGVWLALHLEGRGRLAAESEISELVPGDIAFGPLGAAFRLAFDTDFRQFLVKVPQSVIASRLVKPFSLRVGRSSGKSGFGHVFSGMLGSVAETIDKLTSDQLRPIEIALTEFLSTCLVSDVPEGTLRGATSTQTAILNRICQLIEARLGEHDFSRDTVAAEEGISPRYVQKLFENAGETFAHYLRLRRLERCRAELVNPLYSHLSITDICYRWGFNDSAHFSRAFREQYGMSPRGYRKRVGGAELSRSMLLQLGRGWPDGAAMALHQTNADLHEVPRTARTARGGMRQGIVLRADIASKPGAELAGPRHHYLPANEKTVHWGFFSKLLRPVVTVRSGDLVTIETLTHHANDDFERMVKGDSGAETVFQWTNRHKRIDRRGAGPMDASVFGRGAGEGFGVHICTGPVAVEGAEPGDVLELRILSVRHRPSANPLYAGRAFGSNAAAWWGYHYNDLLTDPKPREVVTIYEIDCMAGEYARAAYSFRWTPQRDPFGVVHPTIDYPGIPVDHASVVENHNVLKGIRIPLRPHFGVIGVAPKEAEIVDFDPALLFRRQSRQLARRARSDDLSAGLGAGGAAFGRRPARRAGRFRALRHRDRMLAHGHVPGRAAQEARSRRAALRRTQLSAARNRERVGDPRLQLRQLSRRTRRGGAERDLQALLARSRDAGCVLEGPALPDEEQGPDRGRGDLADFRWSRFRGHPGRRRELVRPRAPAQGLVPGRGQRRGGAPQLIVRQEARPISGRLASL